MHTSCRRQRVYDVLYLDHSSRGTLVASGLAKGPACELARAEARRRRVGRMFLAGSEIGPVGDVVVIVHHGPTAA
jgi:hypothetical protein